jgi:isoleucyl-tRNA synthetase
MTEDKLAAYQTLYTCLETVVKLSAPFAPFISDRIFCDLNAVSGRHADSSVHLASFPTADEKLVNGDLEEMMSLAQKLSSMVLALRRKVNIKVRQPLMKAMVPVLDAKMAAHIEAARALVMSEVNVKQIELIEQTAGVITKRIKPNFKTLGPRYGKYMKQIAALVATFDQQRIAEIETSEKLMLEVAGEQLEVTREDFEITSEDMPGWLVASEGKLTVALDITVTDELRREGVARELINRIQNLRKDSGLEVTDKIAVEVEALDELSESLAVFGEYVAQQVLAVEIKAVAEPAGEFTATTDLDEKPLRIALSRR